MTSRGRTRHQNQIMYFIFITCVMLFLVIFALVIGVNNAQGGDISTGAIIAAIVPLGAILLGLIVATIINTIKLRKERREREDDIPDEPLRVSIKRFFRRRKRESEETDQTSIPLTDRSYSRFGPGSDRSEEIGSQLNATIKNTESRRKVNLEQFIIRVESDDENCSICKLVLDTKDTIVQCPKCYSLFHFEHLKYWLETNKNCPVCGYRYRRK